MLKKIVTILSIITAGILIATIAAGCGDEEPAGTQPPEEFAAGDDLGRIIEQLRKLSLTVEIIESGTPLAKWSQDGEGSWRFEDPSRPEDYTIFNAKQNKGWQVTGTTALEITDPASLQIFEINNPITMLGTFASIALLPRTGGTDDVSEWDIPGQGTLKIEFKGPNGLVSKVTADLVQTGKTDIEFKYTDLGSVPASTFEVPAGVEVTGSDTGLGGGVEFPSPDSGLGGGADGGGGGGFDVGGEIDIEVPGPPSQ